MPIVQPPLLPTVEDRCKQGTETLVKCREKIRQSTDLDDELRAQFINGVEKIIEASDFARQIDEVGKFRQFLREKIIEKETSETKNWCDQIFQLQIDLAVYWPINFDIDENAVIDCSTCEPVPPENFIATSSGYLFEKSKLQEYFKRNNAFELVKGKNKILLKHPFGTYFNERDIQHFEASGMQIPKRDEALHNKLAWSRILDGDGALIENEAQPKWKSFIESASVLMAKALAFCICLCLIYSYDSSWMSSYLVGVARLVENPDDRFFSALYTMFEGIWDGGLTYALSVMSVQLIASALHLLSIIPLTAATQTLAIASFIIPCIAPSIALYAYATRGEAGNNVKEAFHFVRMIFERSEDAVSRILFYPINLSLYLSVGAVLVTAFVVSALRSGIASVMSGVRQVVQAVANTVRGALSASPLPASAPVPAQMTQNARMHRQLGAVRSESAVPSSGRDDQGSTNAFSLTREQQLDAVNLFRVDNDQPAPTPFRPR